MLAAKFSPKIRETAAQVTHHIQRGDNDFNGVHLRMEEDIQGYMMSRGGIEVVMTDYEKALAENDYNKSVSLYLASGLNASSQSPNAQVRHSLMNVSNQSCRQH